MTFIKNKLSAILLRRWVVLTFLGKIESRQEESGANGSGGAGKTQIFIVNHTEITGVGPELR